jgi:5'(3')-deoxyribonucleotidase
MGTILVDSDSIVANFYFQVLKDHEKATGEALDPHYWDGWDKKLNGVDPLSYFSRPGFFRGLEPIPGAQAVLKGLHDDGHQVVVVSSATLTNAPGEKLEWFSEHFPWIDRKRIIFATEKYRVRGDFFIDDHWHNAAMYKDHNPLAVTIGIQYPYNWLRDYCFDHLAPDFQDFPRAWARINDIIRSHP